MITGNLFNRLPRRRQALPEDDFGQTKKRETGVGHVSLFDRSCNRKWNKY